MPSIGAYEFYTIRGNIPYPGLTVEEITRPGVLGVAFMVTGFKADPVIVETIAGCVTFGALDSAIAGYTSLQGSIVDVEDDFGNERSNILVRKVMPIRQYAITNSTDSYAALLHAQWELQDVTGY